MIIRKTIFILFYSLALLQTNAQQYTGNWETYVVQIGQKPVSIIVDLDFGSSAEAKTRPNVIIVRLNLHNIQSDGMPQRKDIRTLDSIESGLVTTLKDNLSASYTGRYTQDGTRDFYFYTNDTSDCRRYIKEVLQQYPLYIWSAKVRSDIRYSNYFDVLYPTQKEMERIRNRWVVGELRKKGDQLTAPRKVDHYIFFKTEADRKKFARAVQDSGFVIENAGKEIGVKEHPYSLQISRVDKVDYDSIDKVSLYLWKLALGHFGKYDGWETFVVK